MELERVKVAGREDMQLAVQFRMAKKRTAITATQALGERLKKLNAGSEAGGDSEGAESKGGKGSTTSTAPAGKEMSFEGFGQK